PGRSGRVAPAAVAPTAGAAAGAGTAGPASFEPGVVGPTGLATAGPGPAGRWAISTEASGLIRTRSAVTSRPSRAESRTGSSRCSAPERRAGSHSSRGGLCVRSAGDGGGGVTVIGGPPGRSGPEGARGWGGQGGPGRGEAG